VLPEARRLGMGVLTWSPLAFGFLSGKYRKGAPVDMTDRRPTLHPGRFDPELPENAAKYEAVEKLVALADDLGCTLPQLAVAFVVAHPGVTSVILGPRTGRQLEDLLKGADLLLDDATLDRIDEIVPPGVDLYDPTAANSTRPALTDKALRRRPLDERALHRNASYCIDVPRGTSMPIRPNRGTSPRRPSRCRR
jgi:diketogulonate reductase-like aldo/keto reductase